MDVSIGICAYNEEHTIGNLLDDLVMQFVPDPFRIMEIIVVSSGSSDGTNKIVKKFAAKDSRIKLVVEKERRGKAHALNTFLNIAKGDILVIISADTRLGDKALLRLLRAIKEDVGGACANTVPKSKNSSILHTFYQFLWKAHNRMLFKEMNKGTLSHLGGDMWAIRKGIIRKIPAWVINDDAYIGIMLKRKGWKITFVRNAKVFINSPSNPVDFIRQRKRILIGHRQIEKKVGVAPTTIGALALRKPHYSMLVLIEELKSHKIIDYPKIAIGILLEVLCNLLATLSIRKMDLYVLWKQVRSTKTDVPKD